MTASVLGRVKGCGVTGLGDGTIRTGQERKGECRQEIGGGWQNTRREERR